MEAVELAGLAGLRLDDWQQLVLCGGVRQRRGGWSASRVGTWVPRQNGKGAIIEARVLAGLFLLREPLIIWSAHQYNTAQEGFLRIRGLIEATPDLHRQVRRYWTAAGEQGISLKTGQRLRFLARSRTSGRGFTGRCNILDEAQELTSQQVAAIFPTVSAQQGSQLWMFGTPPTDSTAWCYGLRADGEAGKERLAWNDWGADLHPDDRDRWEERDLWYETNPALGIRIPEQTVEDEFGLSGLGDEFPHERLGVWRPRAAGGAGVIPEQLWRDQVDRRPARPAQVALAAVVNHQRTHSAIMAVGPRAAGGMLTSVVDYRPGTHWVVARLVQLRERWDPVAIAVQDKGPTGSLVEDMNQAGLLPPADRDRPQRGELAVPWSDDVAAAYGLFVDAAAERRLWHLDEAPLNLAVASATTRALSGATAWDYRGAPDPSPLIGSTLALWAYVTLADKVSEDYDALESVL